MESHGLDHLVTSAAAEAVFVQEGMHEMLSKKKYPWQSQWQKEMVWWYS